MSNKLLIKRSSTSGKVPTIADIVVGELAMNTYDGRLFMHINNGSDSIIEIGALNSPAFTGIPTAPTASASTNTSQIATTAYVTTAISNAAFVSNSNNIVAGSGISVSKSGTDITISATGSGTGSVTSVALSMPSIFNVSGSPVTTTGTLTATLAGQNANTFLSGPGSGPADIPTFRAIAPADLPLATTTNVGAVSIGAGLTVDVSGVVKLDTNNAVQSFNGRYGTVTLTSADVTGVGGLLANNAALTGTPTAPTAAVNNNTTQIANTAFVTTAINNAISSGTVTAFNGRGGNVILQATDVTGVGGALLNSPTFTGTPAAPTAALGTNTTQIATTAFVAGAISNMSYVSSFNGRTGAVTLTQSDVTNVGIALLSGSDFTGTVTAPTPATSDNSTKVATTAFVKTVVASSGVSTFNGRSGDVSLTSSDILNAGGALLTSPAFTGTPTAPTPATSDNSTQIATTAFVKTALSGYTLPVATGSTPGAVIVGSGINVAPDGTISTTFPVTSVAGKTGAVTLSLSDINGASSLAPINSPSFSGTPLAPTIDPHNLTWSSGQPSDQIATNGFAVAVATQTSTSIGVTGGNVSLGNAANYQYIVITGTLTSDATIVLPGDPGGRWVFYNNTSGSYNVILAGPTANKATFTLQQGGTAEVVCVSSIGVLPATSVGITQPQTDNSTNLATTAFVKSMFAGQTAVTSFNSRVGAITLQTSDVSAVGAAMLTGANFTGAVTAPTPSIGDSSTNVATTQYVEKALLNTTTVSLSSTNVTLTPAQYGTAIIEFTGTLTQSVTITVPTSGQWVMYNATTGAFNVTLSNGQGSTYVVPQNQSASVMSLGSLGIVNANIAAFVLTPATATTLGGVYVPSGNGLTVDNTGAIKASIAGSTSSTTGVVYQGDGITIGSDGKLSANLRTVAGVTPTGGDITLAVGNISGAAPLNSPTFTGTPAAPTPATNDNSTRIATTAFVVNALGSIGVTSFNSRMGAVTLQASDVTGVGGALTASPTFTGTPAAPTPATSDNSTRIATTAFVQSVFAQIGSGVLTFNGRSGSVTLQASDVTGVGGALTASPGFTGTPTAPTATAGTNTTQIATTAFVQTAIAGVSGVSSFNTRTGAVTLTAADVSNVGGAMTASPSFSGTPTAPNPTIGTNTNQIATAQFVESTLFTASSVALSNANVTLSASQYGACIIKLTGTLTANVSITFPTSGQWDVYNATSGSFTVTLTNGTGSNVVAPQGTVTVVMSDNTAGMINTSAYAAANVARIACNIPGSPNVTTETFYLFGQACTLPANLTGATAYGVAAASSSAPYTVNVYKYVGTSSSGTQVGTITVNPGSTSTFATTGGTSVSFAVGDRLSYQFPTGNMTLFAATLVGTWQ
ncbi:hypothetical protein RsoM2USA_418 [Ralstonia phage RsoM2USA]|nr:hypothetical protein RsoM2USA_418 [Ralstonia phage RsoM2USA]